MDLHRDDIIVCTTSERAGLLLEARRHAKTERHGEARHISALRSRDGDGSEGIVLVSQWRSVSPLLLSWGCCSVFPRSRIIMNHVDKSCIVHSQYLGGRFGPFEGHSPIRAKVAACPGDC